MQVEHDVDVFRIPQGGEDLPADPKGRPAVVVLLGRVGELQRYPAQLADGCHGDVTTGRYLPCPALGSDRMLDAVGVGVGPFNLSLAALLAPTGFNARFFDKSADFQWHPGLLLPEATIQVSYLKDLVTLVDPMSRTPSWHSSGPRSGSTDASAGRRLGSVARNSINTCNGWPAACPMSNLARRFVRSGWRRAALPSSSTAGCSAQTPSCLEPAFCRTFRTGPDQTSATSFSIRTTS